MSTAEEILKKHCPSMDDLFLDYSGRQFRDRIVSSMEDYASPLKKRIEELEAEAKTNDRCMKKLYRLIHFWSKESHKWRDCFVTLSRFDSSKHLFSKLLLQAEEYLGDYPRDTALSKDKLSSEEEI